ncbi:threonine/serine exporter ThrE family protein [Cellulomonas sp. NPDC057328]|uniref:threonine/serine ThrE exporter family protein n=1 Tax=Cellulomonas sp. NPDC057328 TaxID=3346101 RepID=UPI00363E1354
MSAPVAPARRADVPPDPAPSTSAPGTPTPSPTPTASPTPAPTTVVPTPTGTPVPTSGTEPAATPTPTPTSTAEPVPTPTSTTVVTPPPSAPPASVPGTVVPWSREPAVATSTLPLGVVVTAALVLLVVTAALVLLHRRTRRTAAGAGAAGGAVAAAGADGTAAAAGAGGAAATAGAGAAGTASGAGSVASLGPQRTTGADHDTDELAEAVTAVLPAVPSDPPTGPVAAAAATGAAAAATAAGPGTSGGPTTPAPPADPAVTMSFLLTMGEALTDASAPVVQVKQTLERIAAVNDLPGLAVVALPTALVVSVPGSAAPQTVASSAGARTLRLHQAADVLHVADDAEAGRVGPVEGTARLRAALDAPPLYGGPARVAGYVASAAGLAMILGGGLVDVLVAGALGAGVAGLQVAGARLPAVYQSLLVLVSAFLVSTAVFALSRTGLDIGTLAPLAAPLVTFLPGALLTTAAIDLATRQMIAGSARLAAGGMQLVLLALGITAAAALVGVPASAVGAASLHPLGWAGPWIGVLVYGCGVVLHNGAHRTALPWILLVLVVAYAGQVLGGVLLGGIPSAFVGALAMTAVAMFAATRPTGPPTLVGFLPGFWLLVPGALGLIGVTSVLDQGAQALTTVVTAGATMVAISLGVLSGIAIGSAVARRTRATASAS